MVITVYKKPNTGVEEEDNIQIDEIKIPQIDSLSILPVRDNVGILLTAQYLRALINHVELSPSLQEDERYARNVDTWKDGSASSETMDIPHHISFRLAVISILQKYGASPDLLFQIS